MHTHFSLLESSDRDFLPSHYARLRHSIAARGADQPEICHYLDQMSCYGKKKIECRKMQSLDRVATCDLAREVVATN